MKSEAWHVVKTSTAKRIENNCPCSQAIMWQLPQDSPSDGNTANNNNGNDSKNNSACDHRFGQINPASFTCKSTSWQLPAPQTS